VIIQLFGIEAEFEGASANDTPLVCEADGEDIYICRGLPGSAGEELEVTSTFDGISPMTVDTEFPPCGGPLEFEDPFALAQVGCQSETEYYAVIDTNITDEIDSWSLEGVDPPLDCGPADPPRPGRFYCNFAIRGWYTTLTFCVEVVDRPPAAQILMTTMALTTMVVVMMILCAVLMIRLNVQQYTPTSAFGMMAPVTIAN